MSKNQTKPAPETDCVKRAPFKPGQHVVVESNSWDCEGYVINDDGGRHILVELDGAGIVNIFYTLLTPVD